jgi:hypothetical protein
MLPAEGEEFIVTMRVLSQWVYLYFAGDGIVVDIDFLGGRGYNSTVRD